MDLIPDATLPVRMKIVVTLSPKLKGIVLPQSSPQFRRSLNEDVDPIGKLLLRFS